MVNSVVLRSLFDRLSSELRERLTQDLDLLQRSKLVLTAEALGLLGEFPELPEQLRSQYQGTDAEGNEIVLQALDALKVKPEGLSFSGSYQLLFGNEQDVCTLADQLIPELKEVVAGGNKFEIAKAFPLLVWFKIPIPQSTCDALLNETSIDWVLYERLNLNYHLALLHPNCDTAPKDLNTLQLLCKQLDADLDVDALWDATLSWGLLAQIIDPEGIGAKVTTRGIPYKGFRDELCFLTTQGVSTTEPFKQAAPAPLKLSVYETGPKLTILVPVFNSESTLEETLASIQRHHYRNWEAAIIDGPSTDATRAIAEKWAAYDPRFKVVAQKDKGLANARNDGIEATESALIHCLDGDDVLDPDFYALMIHHLLQLDESPVGRCAVSTVKKFSGRNCVFLDCPPLAAENMRFGFFAEGGNSAVKSIVFERKILEQTGVFDGSLKSCEDWDLWTRFFRVKVSAVGVAGAIGWYRILADSLSRDYIPYINTFKRVAMRATAEDERLANAVDQEAPADLAVVEKGLVRFWLENVRRSTCQLDEESTQMLFTWAQEELIEEFWLHPNHFHSNYKFRVVDVGDDIVDDNWELNARLLYLKAFGLWWKGAPIVSMLITQIEGLLYLCKTGDVSQELKNRALAVFAEEPYKKATGLKLKWHLRQLRA